MSKLTDTQLVALSTAAQRDDRVIVLPEHLKGGAAAAVVKPLLAKKLAKEILAKPGMAVWRHDKEEGRPYALIITRAGCAAINVEPAAETGDSADGQRSAETAAAPTSHERPRKTRSRGEHKEPAPHPAAASIAAKAPRAGSKLALVVKMLDRVRGVSIDDLTAATDWLPHTARAVITSLRNRGYRVETERNRDDKTIYRIVGAENAETHRDAA